MKYITLTIIILSFSLIGVVHATTFVYDDFSSGSLDINKWEILQSALQQMYVDTQNQVLHVEQVTPATSDAYAMLRIGNYTFYPGDVLEYDVYHNAGSSGSYISEHVAWNYIGNRIDNEWFSVGFWGTKGTLQLGDATGNYHYAIRVGNSSFTVTVTAPDSTIHSKEYSGQPPFKFGISTEVGVGGTGGGVTHFDYDNFVISIGTILPPTLDQRVNILEQQVQNLTTRLDNNEYRISWLEQAVKKLSGLVSKLIGNVPKIEQVV